MVYEYNKIISASELSLLRESVGWNRMEKELSNPIMNSYCNIAVYDENELVGYIDCVSNGVTGGVYKTRERIHRDILIRDY